MTAVAVSVAGVVAPMGVVHAQPGVSPDDVEAIIFPGQSIDVEKTVTTAVIPPKVDVCLLQDETGSYDDDLANLQAAAEGIFDTVDLQTSEARFAVAGFRDYPIDPFGDPGDWVYRLVGPMSAVKADWLNGVNALTAANGGDDPEAQYDAIVAATGPGSFLDPTLGEHNPCGFGADPDVARVLVVTTDDTFHAPDGTHVNGAASTIAALLAADVTVVGLKAPGAGAELDALAAATGGSTQPLSSNSDNIAAAILAGLSALPVTVEMQSDCVAPITTTFDPAEQTVTSGEDAVFTETISVAADAPGGTYTCTDFVFFNGVQQEFVETKTIMVPEGFLTGGGRLGEGRTGVSFGGNVGFLEDFSTVGQWQFNDPSGKLIMHSTSIDAIQFANDGGDGPAPPPANANIASFSGTARVKDGPGPFLEGCTFDAYAEDRGEPGSSDVFGIDIDCTAVGGASASYGPAVMSGGNMQIHSGLKG